MSIYSRFHSGNYVGRLRKAKRTRFSFANHDIWAGMLRRFIDKYSIDVLNSQCIHAIVFTICVEAIYIDLPSLFLWVSCGPRTRLCIMWYFITRKNGEMIDVRKFSLLLILGILLRWWRHDQLCCGVYRVCLRWSTHTPTGKANIQQGSLIRNCYTDEIYSFVDWKMSWLCQTRPLLQPHTIFCF